MASNSRLSSAAEPLDEGSHTDIAIENFHLRITLDSENGSIRSIRNIASGLELIAPDDVGATPWRLQLTALDPKLFDRRPSLRGKVFGKTEIVLHFLKEIVGGTWSSNFASFRWSYDGEYGLGTAVDLSWSRRDGIELNGRVELPDDALDASFTMRVTNSGEQTVLALAYPIIDGIQALGATSEDNYLAHSVDGGFLFKDPHRLFRDEGILKFWKQLRIIENTSPNGYLDEPTAHGGLYRTRPYPNGFEGSSMQFFGFFKEDVGGFYFAAHDPHNTEKMLNFYGSEGRNHLTSNFVHYSWDWHRGSGLEIDYPTMIGALHRGTWYEAADRYRAWATRSGNGHPDWCDMGTLRQRVANGTASKWLVDEVGFNTFGMPISFDVSKWYDAFHRITGKPVFHITGHDWEGGAVAIRPEKWSKLCDLLAANNPAPSLYELADVLGVPADEGNLDYLRDVMFKFRQNLWGAFHIEPLKHSPPIFNDPNMAAIRSNGDYLAPFLWRDFIGYGHDTEKYGTLTPITPFTNAFMCPSTEYWQNWHSSTDIEMVEAGVDSIYFDVSASCATPTLCMNAQHDHPLGFGRQMIRSYEEVFRKSKQAVSEINDGQYVPIGTEVIIENLIGVVDYAQCRAGAGVQASMEGEEFAPWQKDRRAIKIPMFSYVYHEYGPVLLDGWGKLSKEYGDVFFEIASRVALEGGLVQLNYEFSSLELFPDMQGSSYQLVYTGQIFEDEFPLPVDTRKLEFLREVAEARTGFAKDFLAYGRMVPSLKILTEVLPIDLDWQHFNSVHGLRPEGGIYRTDSVIHVAWSDTQHKLGFLFVNLLPDDAQTIGVAPNPSDYGLDGRAYSAELKTMDDNEKLGQFDGGAQLSISLPPRKVVLLEITESAAA